MHIIISSLYLNKSQIHYKRLQTCSICSEIKCLIHTLLLRVNYDKDNLKFGICINDSNIDQLYLSIHPLMLSPSVTISECQECEVRKLLIHITKLVCCFLLSVIVYLYT